MAKKPNPKPAPSAEPASDPADAFARAEPFPSLEDLAPNEDEQISAPIAEDKPKRKKGGAPRAPKVEIAEDDGMDPFDAATEITGLMDNAFAMLCHIRGYNLIMVSPGEGQPQVAVLSMVAPTEEAKERLRRALARVLKSAGANMSPGAGLALAAFGCYGAPIIGLEMAKAGSKKKATA